MEIKASLTIAIRDDEVCIQVEDRDSSTRFLDIKIGHSDFLQALGRQAFMKCTGTLRGLDYVGKQMENRTFEFPFACGFVYGERRKELARVEVFSALVAAEMEDWLPDELFSSQGSFFNQGDQPMARTIIRRWVDKSVVKIDSSAKGEREELVDSKDL